MLPPFVLVPFQSHHLTELKIQPGQSAWLSALPELAPYFAQTPSFAGIAGGRGVICAGVAFDDGKPIAWAGLAGDAGPYLFQITRATQLFLDKTCPYERVYTVIDQDFPQAVRWAELLGFRFVGKSTYKRPDGKAMDLYARARRDPPGPAAASSVG